MMCESESYPTIEHYLSLFKEAETPKMGGGKRCQSAYLPRTLSEKWLAEVVEEEEEEEEEEYLESAASVTDRWLTDLEDQRDYERLCRMHQQSTSVSVGFIKKMSQSMLSIDEEKSMDDVWLNAYQTNIGCTPPSSTSGSSYSLGSSYSSDDEPSLRRDSALTQRSVDWDSFLSLQSSHEWVIIEGYENCGFSKAGEDFRDKSLLCLHQEHKEQTRELEQKLTAQLGDVLRGMNSVSRCNSKTASVDQHRMPYWEVKMMLKYTDLTQYECFSQL